MSFLPQADPTGNTDRAERTRLNSAVVVADHLGEIGGGALAPLLLSKELTQAGLQTVVFAHHLMPGFTSAGHPFKVVTPRIRSGCRWQWPERCLAAQVNAFITRNRPDVLISCGITGLTRFLLKTSAAPHTAVWEFTNAIPDNKLVDRKTIALLPRARAVLSPSLAIDEGIRSSYGYHGPIVRLPFWIEDPILASHRSLNGKRIDFIYLGRRDPEKGIHELIEATARVADQYPGISVLIAGPGNESPFAEHARRLGVADRVSFRFLERYEDVLHTLSQSRCLVLPSYHEGYPLVLLEACALGVPFIATAVGSVPELFKGSQAGLTVPPRDHEALANGMLAMLDMTPEETKARCTATRAAFEALSGSERVRRNLQECLTALSEIGKK